MKRLTVAAAAFAAGMLIIVAQSQAESDHHMLGSIAKAAAKDKTAGRTEARTADAGADKRKGGQNAGAAKRPRMTTASLQGKRTSKGRVKINKPGVDLQRTASVAPRAHPELKAIARKAVIGLASVQPDTQVASAAAYTAVVARYASIYDVPASLAHAVISIESNYSPRKLGAAGEVGLMQIKPATAQLMGYSGSVRGLYDPETNIKFGMKYLGMAIQLSRGDTCGAILRYNAGHGATRMNPVSAAYCQKVKRLLNG
jgi:soluble lytic murein transglycosylase-like protein